jgi:hypothetical protein
VIATVITPCSLEHRQYLPKVIQSVQGLKTPVRHLIGIDLHRRGAGYVRNGLLKHVTTPYVIFLDADDEIHPEFLDHTLPHIAPQKYVYTAWSQQYSDVYPVDANNIWYNGTYHLITTLLNTSDVVRAGGFDVTLSALEDTEFYVKLITDYCVCPVYVPKPLLTYTNTPNSRSKMSVQTGEDNKIKQIILQRYNKMACCQSTPQKLFDLGEKQEGDVLAEPLWRGNRYYTGLATGRNYGRIAYPRQFWCDPADVQRDTRNIRIVVQTSIPEPTILDDAHIGVIDVNQLEGVDAFAYAMGMDISKPIPDTPLTPKPDIGKITKRKPKTP